MSAPWPVTLFLALATALSAVPSSIGFLSPPSFLSLGFCKEAQVQPGIDFREFSGLWYTVEKVPNEYDPDVACTNTDYAYYGTYLRSSQRGLLVDRSKHKINTVLTFNNDTADVMMVHSPGFPLAPLMILSTDYSTYACMYTCMDFLGFKAEFAFTMSRAPLASRVTLQTCRNVYVDKVDLDPGTMELVEQGKTCPYWSKLHENETTLLRGDNQIQTEWNGDDVAAPSSNQLTTNSATSLSSSSSELYGVFSLLFWMLIARERECWSTVLGVVYC